MTKYEPLTHYLHVQLDDEVRMSFSEIERVLRVTLPRSASTQRSFWSNNASNNVMTKAWLEAGFETEQVDLAGRKVVFRRVRPGSGPAVLSGASRSGFMEKATPLVGQPSSSKRSLFGWLRGTVSVAPDADLASPADPEWSQRIDDDRSPAA